MNTMSENTKAADAIAITPGTEKVPSIYHDAQPEHHINSADQKAPVSQSVGSDGTAALQHEGSPNTTEGKRTITDEKEKHLVDSEQPVNNEQQETSATAGSSQLQSSQPPQSQSAHERVMTAESNMSPESRANLEKSESMHTTTLTHIYYLRYREGSKTIN
jgi:hypothetical protein